MTKNENIALPSCASQLVPAGSGLWLAHGWFLLLISSHAPVVDLPGSVWKWRKDYASSRLLFLFHCRFLLGLLVFPRASDCSCFPPWAKHYEKKILFFFFSARRIERCTPKRPSIFKWLAVKRSAENALPGALFLSRFSTSFLPARAFKGIFGCENRLRYSRERARQKFAKNEASRENKLHKKIAT